MIPAQFDYVRPADLDEALKILTEREGEAKLLAGGYSLIPLLKLRLAQPGLLVDLRDVTGLDGIVETDDELRDRGAAPRTARSTSTPRSSRDTRCSTTCRAASAIPRSATGERSVARVPMPTPRRTGRRRSWPSTPRSSAAAPGGERVIAARDFFIDTFQTAIEPTEVLTEIRFGRPGRGAGTRLPQARAASR